jgi:hypothetical protein
MGDQLNSLITNVVDVIEIHSNTDLVLETNTQIRFSTSNLLINYIPFDEYIRHIVFHETFTNVDEPSIHTTWTRGVPILPGTNIDNADNLIDLNGNTSELILDEVQTSGVSAKHSHINDKHHYINISANDNIRFVNNVDPQNIAYKKYTDSASDQLTSLENYIYNVVNGNFNIETLQLSSLSPPTVRNEDITNRGIYIGNKITTQKLSTTNVFIDADEPMLNVDSMTAINFVTNVDNCSPGVIDIASTTGSKIYFGLDVNSINLDTFIKSQLDEDPNNFIFGLNIQSGTEIVASYIDISSGENIFFGFVNFVHGNIFNYTITYKMYVQDDFEGGIMSTATSTNVFTLTEPPTDPPTEPPTEFPQNINFTGLVTGTTYMLYATLLNNVTNTTVDNILISENIATIPNVSIVSVTIVNEYTLNIIWTPIDIDGINETVEFNTILDWTGRDDVLLNTVSTSKSQNLRNVVPTSNFTFTLTLTNATIDMGYNTEGYYLINVDHNVIIETQPYNMQVSYQLTSIQINQAFETTLSGTSLNITSPSNNNYSFSWNKPSTSNTKITLFSYEIYFETTLMTTIKANSATQNVYNHTGTNIVGNWYVKLNTLYNITPTAQLTTAILTVNSPSFAIVSTTPNGNRTFKFTISSQIYNISYSLSGTNLTSSSGSTVINTTELSTGSYAFTIILTDGLRLVTSRNTGANSITIVSPSFTLSPTPVFVTKPRIFSVSSSSFVYNGTLLSVSLTSVTNGSFYSSGSSNNLLNFQLNNGISPGNKVVTVVLTDSWGYTVTKTATLNLTIPFYLSNNTVSNVGYLTFQSNATVSGGSTFTYQWNVGDSTNTISLDETYSGTLHCLIVETNTYGFTKSTASSSITITQPTMTSNSFTIAEDETAFSYNINTFSYNINQPSNPYDAFVKIGLSLSSSSYNNVGGEDFQNTSNGITSGTYTTTLNKGTIYYLWGKITDGYGFGGIFRYLSLFVETSHVAPAPITLLNTETSSSSTENSMTIYWEYGDIGTATSVVMGVVITLSTGEVITTHTTTYPISQKEITGLSAATRYTVTITMTTNIDSKVTITGNVVSNNFSTNVDFSSVNLCLKFYDMVIESRTRPHYISLYSERDHDFLSFLSINGRPVVWRSHGMTNIDRYYAMHGIERVSESNNDLIMQKYNFESNLYGIKIYHRDETVTTSGMYNSYRLLHYIQVNTIKTLLNRMFVNNDVSYENAGHATYYVSAGTYEEEEEYTEYFEAGLINIIIKIYPDRITSNSGNTEEPVI